MFIYRKRADDAAEDGGEENNKNNFSEFASWPKNFFSSASSNF